MAGGATFGLLAGRIINGRSRASVSLYAGITSASAQAGRAWNQEGQSVPRRSLARLRSGTLFTTFALGIGGLILLGLMSFSYAAQTGAPLILQPGDVLSPTNAGSVVQLSQLNLSDVTQAVYSSDGMWLVVATSRGVAFYDALTMAAVRTLKTGPSDTLALSPNGETLATSQSVTDLAFSPDGTMLATASLDRRVRLWRTEDADLHTWFTHFGGVHSLAYSPDGGFLATGTSLGLSVWRLADSTRLQIPAMNTNRANRMVFSPDGALLAVATEGGAVWLRRMYGQGEWLTLTRHARSVRDVVFSPDGALLASASDDGTIRLWQTRDGAPIHTLLGHNAPVTALAFHPDGTALLSGSADGSVRLWGLEQVVEAVRIEKIQFTGVTIDAENLVLSDLPPFEGRRTMECADSLIWASSYPMGLYWPPRDGIWSFDGQEWQQHFVGFSAIVLCTPGGPPLVIRNTLETDRDDTEAQSNVALFVRQSDEWIERSELLHPIIFDLFQGSQWRIHDIAIDFEENFWVVGSFRPTAEQRDHTFPFLLRFNSLGEDVYAPQAGLEVMRHALVENQVESNGYSSTRFHAVDLLDFHPYSLKIAPNGVLWMFGEEGVAHFDGSQWIHIPAEHSAYLSFFTLDATGGFWATTETGVLHHDAHGWTRYESGDTSLDTFLVPLAVDAHGRIWFWDLAGPDESKFLLIRYDGIVWQRYAYSSEQIFMHWLGENAVTDAAAIFTEGVVFWLVMHMLMDGAHVASDGALWISALRIMPDGVPAIPFHE
jgi:WD40 repeat protein